eukprot:g14740.t1
MVSVASQVLSISYEGMTCLIMEGLGALTEAQLLEKQLPTRLVLVVNKCTLDYKASALEDALAKDHGRRDSRDAIKRAFPRRHFVAIPFDPSGGDAYQQGLNALRVKCINSADLGKSARSYVRKVQVWLRCTKMAPNRRALALYNELTGRAWIYAEELDVDRLATDGGVSYYLEWIQTRFMEVEITKVSNMMGDLFRRCRRRSDQSIRDFNVEFERLVLRLREVQCELPAMVKGWLYLDKLRLTEHEELSLLSSVNNQFDARKLQQAALLQDRSLRRPAAGNETTTWKGRGTWRQQKHSVHMTNNEEERSSEEDPLGDDEEGLVSEDLAAEEYQAYMTYQNAKSKYKEALKGRGADMEEIKKRSAERLKLAKERSYCSACKRKGHWHKDPECPLRSRSAGSHEANVTVHSAQMCDVVHDCYVTAKNDTVDDDYLKGKLLAIVDTACTKAVAGHDWFERYSDMNEGLNFEPPHIYEHEEFFRFGASRVFTSHFGIAAWIWFAWLRGGLNRRSAWPRATPTRRRRTWADGAASANQGRGQQLRWVVDQGIAAIQGLSQPGPDTDIADDVLEEQARGEEALMAYILGEDDQLNNQVPVIISDDEDKDGASVGASGETEYKVGAINIEDDSNETSEGTENGTTSGSEDEASERPSADHVDDIMLMTEPKILEVMQKEIKNKFPVDEWEQDDFEYVGCEYHCEEGHITIKQKGYAGSRVEKEKLIGSELEELTFANLRSMERSFIHRAAQELGLFSCSQGTGLGRQLLVRRTPQEDTDALEVPVEAPEPPVVQRSEEGRLYQVEYAMEAINLAGSTVGVLAEDGQDANILINRLRLTAQQHTYSFSEPMPVEQLVTSICDYKQGYTQFGGLRPFGVSFLVAGYDAHHGFQLYHTDPSGNFSGWKGYAIGVNNNTAMQIMRQDWKPGMKLQEALDLTAKVLVKTMDTASPTAERLEFGIVYKTPEGQRCEEEETGRTFAMKVFRKLPLRRQREHVPGGQVMDWDEVKCRFFAVGMAAQEADASGLIPEEKMKVYLSDLLEALSYLHAVAMVAHRDVKPQNLLLDGSSTLKLGDFGVAAKMDEDHLVHGTEGTYPFFSPEMCQTGYVGHDGRKADMWNCLKVTPCLKTAADCSNGCSCRILLHGL